MNNQIDYVEFLSNDTEASKRFYSSAFGWDFTDYGPDYTSFADGRIAGGFTKDTGHTPGILVVIYADDLEATEQKIKSAGAKIVRPIFSFPGGRRFHFADPNGHELAVWSDK